MRKSRYDGTQHWHAVRVGDSEYIFRFAQASQSWDCLVFDPSQLVTDDYFRNVSVLGPQFVEISK